MRIFSTNTILIMHNPETCLCNCDDQVPVDVIAMEEETSSTLPCHELGVITTLLQ